MLKLLHERKTLPDNLAEVAAANDSEFALKFAIEYGYDTEYVCATALKNSNFALYRFARDIGCPFDLIQMSEPSKYSMDGHMTELLDLSQRASRGIPPFELAICHGADLDFLKLIHQNGAKLTRRCFQKAVAIGNIPIMNYLNEQGCEWSEDDYYSHGHSYYDYFNDGCPFDRNFYGFREATD